MKSRSSEALRSKRLFIGVGALVLMVLIVYLPAIHCGYVWDDDAYVTANPLLTDANGLKRIWFSFDSPSQYFPLVYTTFRMEHALWGFDPLGYHLVNVLIHILNALLVWLVLSRLRIRGAWLAAAIFALHPVNVESVAWITERKNTLSTLFSLLTIISWLRFTSKDSQRWRYYGLALILYALALFAKTTACTIPAALIIVLWIEGERVDWKRAGQVAPFLVMGIAMGLLSVWWEQGHQGTHGPEFDLRPIQRVLLAGHGIWFYLSKLVWPAKLTFSYPKWALDPSDPIGWTWLAALIVLAAVLWLQRKWFGYGPLLAFGFFAAVLSPMLGFISLYTFRYTYVADHYQYVACLGPISLFSAGMLKTWRVRDRKLAIPLAVPMLILMILGILTWRQAHIYKDAETLWRDTLAKNPSSWMACANLGNRLANEGRPDEALCYYLRTLELNPAHRDIHFSIAVVLCIKGQYSEAWKHVHVCQRRGERVDPAFLTDLSKVMPDPGQE